MEIWHNPRCSKSRQTLALMEEHGVAPDIILYLDEKLTQKRLKEVLAFLGMSAKDVLRKGEKVWKEQGQKPDAMSEAALVKLMVENPILIERPIIIKGQRAVLGRPPENVLDLL